MTNEKTLCIYHGNCADGFAGAWVVRKAFGERVDFHAGVYGAPPPEVRGRGVVLVDFSYPRNVIERLADEADYILVFDHHKSAIADLAGFQHPKVRMVLDNNRSGARIVWDFFFVANPPQLVLHIEDRDLWRFALPGTREIAAGLFSHPYDFELWDTLMEPDSLASLEADGRAIERKHQKDVDELLKITTRSMVIGGVTVPAANLPYTMASDAAGQLAINMPFAATYYDTATERFFSLRSASDGMDVSEIAKLYGGGGHKHAAGFRVSLNKASPVEIGAEVVA